MKPADRLDVSWHGWFPSLSLGQESLWNRADPCLGYLHTTMLMECTLAEEVLDGWSHQEDMGMGVLLARCVQIFCGRGPVPSLENFCRIYLAGGESTEHCESRTCC